jgi:predicted nicotinamide N-methyase
VKNEEVEGNTIESDVLATLVYRLSLTKASMPTANESCYLSFRLPGGSKMYDNDNKETLLRIRVFPYHNDVALRLWEAGACLAEFFLEHPNILARKDVIELGAGVGLTGLAIAACCKPSTVHLTDYTEQCRLNLEHNLQLNHTLLSRYGFSPDRIAQVGMKEWNDRRIKNDEGGGILTHLKN